MLPAALEYPSGDWNGFRVYRPARGGRSCEHFGGYKTINRIPFNKQNKTKKSNHKKNQKKIPTYLLYFFRTVTGNKQYFFLGLSQPENQATAEPACRVLYSYGCLLVRYMLPAALEYPSGDWNGFRVYRPARGGLVLWTFRWIQDYKPNTF